MLKAVETANGANLNVNKLLTKYKQKINLKKPINKLLKVWYNYYSKKREVTQMEKKLHHQFINETTGEAIALPKENFPTIGECILHLEDCFDDIRDWKYCGCGIW